MFVEELGVEFDVTGLVNTMYVAECSSNAEIGADLGKRFVDIPNVFRLGVELGVVNASVVDTILLTASNADFHLEPKAEGGHALKVFHASSDVLLLGLLGKVKHVGGEQGLAVLLEVLFIGLEHTIEPGEKFVGTVVGVENHRTELYLLEERSKIVVRVLTLHTLLRPCGCGGQQQRHQESKPAACRWQYPCPRSMRYHPGSIGE